MAAKKREPAQDPEAPETAPETEAPVEGEIEEAPKAPDTDALLRAEQEKYLRLAAEYDNYRKRSARERESIYADVRAATLEGFLPTYDNLERALKQSTEDEAYKKGVEMIMSGFLGAMDKLGVVVYG